MDEKAKREKELNDKWREGYDMGMKNALHQERQAIAIGNAILTVLDNCYKFAEEDY